MKNISMLGLKVSKTEKFLIFFTGSTIGLIVSLLASNGPFTHFSENHVFALIKVILCILISSSILYFIASTVSQKLMNIVFLAFFLRIITVFFMSIFGILPYQYDNNWDLTASQLLPSWHAGNFYFDVGNGFEPYSILTTIIYFLLGENPIYMQLLNAFFGALTIYVIFLICLKLFNKRVAYLTSIIIALWPTYIFFISMQMRESLAIFFITLLIYFFINWLNDFKIKNLIGVLIALIFSALIREQNAVLVTLILFPFVIVHFWKNSNKYLKIFSVIFSFVGLIIAFLILNVSGYLSYLNLNYISEEMNYRTDGETAYLAWMNYSSIFDLIIYSPIRLIYFVYTPFPWQITDFQQAISFLESIVLIIMTFYILKNIKKIINYSLYKKGFFFLIAFCLLGLIANGLIDSNVGTAIRHKLQYLYLFIILFVAAWDYNKTKVLNEKTRYNSD
ncbi:hypothetical protein CHL76_01210 [Marinococcus halophilus]|uniref:Glycosyltransferase RgtA/B/C/D-like domain-containing protein n=1 Tax=Marinococcus halophilus TaxID=1371 RepID=A0A510Y307_MARHA|nr:glycosyltransferase family 39 protein [Marinococcus halophilus]OZT81741.1 hypothetical protein CHL76_01210 [Marinococcus halophilus]GEK57699.1 hypothetical protein MHA01_06040 [Marinococcus halophilus]